MVKTYFKYQLERNVGQVAGTQCNVAYHPGTKRIFSGVNQQVAVVARRTGEVLAYLSREHKNRLVRHVAVFGERVYAGYAATDCRYEDGDILVWNCTTLEFLMSLDQHKSAVSSMACSSDETIMVSAGQDCRIVIWDLLSEESSSM